MLAELMPAALNPRYKRALTDLLEVPLKQVNLPDGLEPKSGRETPPLST